MGRRLLLGSVCLHLKGLCSRCLPPRARPCPGSTFVFRRWWQRGCQLKSPALCAKSTSLFGGVSGSSVSGPCVSHVALSLCSSLLTGWGARRPVSATGVTGVMSRSRPPPLVTGISPNEGIPWTKVTIRGENLGTGTPDLIGKQGRCCVFSARASRLSREALLGIWRREENAAVVCSGPSG